MYARMMLKAKFRSLGVMIWDLDVLNIHPIKGDCVKIFIILWHEFPILLGDSCSHILYMYTKFPREIKYGGRFDPDTWSRPKNGAQIVLHQIVTDCDMPHAIFLDCWIHLWNISKMLHLEKVLLIRRVC